jgi:hypothetical protein
MSLNMILASVFLAFLTACAGGEGFEESELGQIPQAVVAEKAPTRVLGTRPASSDWTTSNRKCYPTQTTSADCRFVATDSYSSSTNFIYVGVDETGMTADEKSQMSQALDAALAGLNTGGPAFGTVSRFSFTKVPYAESQIAFRKASVGAAANGNLTQVMNDFAQVSFHGCNSAMAETYAVNGSFRSCGSGIVSFDYVDILNKSTSLGLPVTVNPNRHQKTMRAVMAYGVLAAIGFGHQAVHTSHKNSNTLSAAMINSTSYWGPATSTGQNPTRCIADRVCYGPLQGGVGDGGLTPCGFQLSSAAYISTVSALSACQSQAD